MVAHSATGWAVPTIVLPGGPPALVGWLCNRLGPKPRTLIFARGLIAIPARIGSAVASSASGKPFAEPSRYADCAVAAPEHHAILEERAER